MTLKKNVLVPVALIGAIAVGALTGCTTSSSASDVKTTGTATPKSGLSIEFNPKNFPDLPQDIPYLDEYKDAKADGDQATGNFTLKLTTDQKNAVNAAAKKLTEKGFTAAGTNVYKNASWKVTLTGTGGSVTYTIAKA